MPPYTEMANRVAYYERWTPAQKASFQVSKFLESNLLFLDQNALSLNALLGRAPIPPRNGVWVFPTFPVGWVSTSADRQNKMTDRVLQDSAVNAGVRSCWNRLGMLDTTRAAAGDALMPMLNQIKTDIDKLRKRGVQVYFIKCPVDIPYVGAEKSKFPRQLFWDKLLSFTGTEGIHFENYPTLAKYKCPEGSHLSAHDAIPFTVEIVRILKEEKGWKPSRDN